VRALNEIFQFMSPDAFKKHCDELVDVLKEYKTKQAVSGGFFHLSNDAKESNNKNDFGKHNNTNAQDNITLYST
jgi:hypothetical protein